MSNWKARMSYKQFCKEAFENGADYIVRQYDGTKGVNKVLIAATAVNQRHPKVTAFWVKNRGVWQEDLHG